MKKHHAVQQGIVTSRIGRRVRQARRLGMVTTLPPRPVTYADENPFSSAPSLGVGKPHNVIKYCITAVGTGFCLRSECISMNFFVPSAIWPRRTPDFTIHSL